MRKLVFAAVMLAMPLQGVAATLAALMCDAGGMVHMHATGDADHDAHHVNLPDEGGMSGPHADHPCCGHFVSSSTHTSVPAALPDFPVRALAPDPLHDLFFPERPHRPPLA